MGREVKVGIVVTGKDASGPALQSAGKGVTDLTKKTQAQDKTLRAMAQRMVSLSGQFAGLGGAASSAFGPMGNLVGMMASGGPLGAGVAALGIGVGALAAAWAKHTEEIRQTQRYLDSGLDAISRNMDAVRALEDQIKHFGKSALEAEAAQLEEVIAKQRKSIDIDREALRAKKSLREGWGEIVRVGEEAGDAIDNDRQINADTLAQNKYILAQNEDRLGQVRRLLQMQQDKTATDEKAAAAARDVADADRDAAQAERERIAARAKAIADLEKANALAAAVDKADLEDLAKLNGLVLAAEKARLTEGEQAAAKQRQAAAAFDEEENKRLRDRAALVGEIGNAWATAGATMITSSEDAGKAALQATAETARAAILAAAASSAGQAFFSQAGIPFIGPALGAIAATAAYALVSGYAAKMATGGVVRGGIPGRDSVPILAQQGERVLTVQQNREWERGGRQGAPGGMTLNLNLPVSQVVPDRVALAKTVRGELGRALREGFADGTLRVPRMAVT